MGCRIYSVSLITKWGQCVHYQIETPSLKIEVSETTKLLVKKFEGGVGIIVYSMLSQKKRYRLGLYHLESHHAKFQFLPMRNE